MHALSISGVCWEIPCDSAVPLTQQGSASPYTDRTEERADTSVPDPLQHGQGRAELLLRSNESYRNSSHGKENGRKRSQSNHGKLKVKF